jgi:hypothetical protein
VQALRAQASKRQYKDKNTTQKYYKDKNTTQK